MFVKIVHTSRYETPKPLRDVPEPFTLVECAGMDIGWYLPEPRTPDEEMQHDALVSALESGESDGSGVTFYAYMTLTKPSGGVLREFTFTPEMGEKHIYLMDDSGKTIERVAVRWLS